METSPPPAGTRREEQWPLIVASCIALPIVIGFAFWMSRGAEEHEVRHVLVSFLFVTAAVSVAVVAATTFVIKLRHRSRQRRLNPQGSAATDMDRRQLAEHPDLSSPAADRAAPLRREFSVGPGLSLHERYHRQPPQPQRRI